MTTRHIEAGARPRPALVALACFLWACGDGGGDLQDNNPPAVAEVTVEAAATTIAVGDSVQLQAVALDAGGNALEDRTVEWASANTDVATVSATGMVTGRSAGEARINATVEAVSGTIAITVSSTEPPRQRRRLRRLGPAPRDWNRSRAASPSRSVSPRPQATSDSSS